MLVWSEGELGCAVTDEPISVGNFMKEECSFEEGAVVSMSLGAAASDAALRSAVSVSVSVFLNSLMGLS